MSLLIIILAVGGLTALSWGALHVYELLTHDGLGRLTVHRTPPPSHPDQVEPGRAA